MPITELALLRLTPDTCRTSPTLASALSTAKTAMESFTSYPFYFYTQVEDPAYIYVIGRWDSLAQHVDEWIPSDANQDILKSVKGLVDVVWLVHMDLGQRKVPVEAGVMRIDRYGVKKGRKGDVERVVEGQKSALDRACAPISVAGGWRIDCEEEGGDARDEYVLFRGWRHVREHEEYSQTEECKVYYRKMRDSLEMLDVKHAVRWDI